MMQITLYVEMFQECKLKKNNLKAALHLLNQTLRYLKLKRTQDYGKFISRQKLTFSTRVLQDSNLFKAS